MSALPERRPLKTQMPGIDAAEAMRQAERITASEVFAKAKRSQRLLRYLVDAAVAEPPRAVKEYTLATEVFDRDASYDPAIDATVRVEAGRLRSRLREYYGQEGKDDALLIELPRGAYRLSLTSRADLMKLPAERLMASPVAASEPVKSLDVASSLDPGALHARPEAPDPSTAAASTNLIAPRHGMTAKGWLLTLLSFGCVLGFAGWRMARFTPSESLVRSVAVLPLKNLSGDPAQDYFADGTTDELITELARVPGLRVVSWNSVIQEKDTKKSLKTISGELRADLLVEGSIFRSGDTVRINAQLIDTKNDGHLWANSFEGPINGIMALESRAAQEIVSKARSGGQSGPVNPHVQSIPTVDPAAHDAYLHARNYFDKRQAQESASEFRRAIDLSPTYASAYSGLAAALENEALLGQARPEQVLPQAMVAVQKALELDPENGDALIARGSIETAFLWQWDAAERDLIRGVALSPNNSYGHMMLSVYLDSLGRLDDAVKQMQQAEEIDPLSFFMARHYGSALFYARRYDEALRQLKYAREMHPASAGVVDRWISGVNAKMGRQDDAVQYEILQLQDEHSNLDLEKLLSIYRTHGWQAFWMARLQEVDQNRSDPCDGYVSGIIALRAGRHDEAMAALRRATEQHCYWMGVARTDPLLDDARAEPGFSDLVAALHLPPDSRP